MMMNTCGMRELALVCRVLAIIMGFVGVARAEEVRSPDGNVEIAFEARADGARRGCLFWRVSYKGKTILTDSRLGLALKGERNLDEGFAVKKVSRSSRDETWKPVYGERSEIRDRYNEMAVDLRQTGEGGRALRLVFRVYDEGAAFRYEFPEERGRGEFTIEREDTEFCFAGNHRAWAVYSAQGLYKKVRLNEVKKNCERPLTVEIEGGPVAAVAEARLVDYARMRLRPLGDGRTGVASQLGSEVVARAPYHSPWRVLMLADSVGDLLERNYLILNLNDPCAIEDTSWIKPGKVIREVSLTTDGGMACVDFAVERGLQYVEYDAGWYGLEYDADQDARTISVDPKRSPGPLDLHRVIAYAKSRGIGIILYVNRRHLEKQLDEILPLYRDWGVAGVKYGFVRVGDQKWTAWLHEAVRKAAENRLLVDVHDEYRPTGYSRTYPNLMTQEGVGGNETMPTAEQDTIFPFTRYLCGAADYTVCWYSGRVKNTLAHQLAASVVYYSPLQFLHWYDRPGQYENAGPEVDFFKHVPAVWDESRVLEGAVGQYAVLARRSGATWFVGALNAVERRRMDLPLSFLEKGKRYEAHVHKDGSPEGGGRTKVAIRRVEVDSRSVLELDMAANGGCAVRVVPMD